jgi:prepilin-type N-terminal cleavage/methylation domain-containing protein
VGANCASLNELLISDDSANTLHISGKKILAMGLNMMSRLHSQSGVSMLEMMIVVVLIGLLAAIAVPNFNGAVDKMKFEIRQQRQTGSYLHRSGE